MCSQRNPRKADLISFNATRGKASSGRRKNAPCCVAMRWANRPVGVLGAGGVTGVLAGFAASAKKRIKGILQSPEPASMATALLSPGRVRENRRRL